MKGPIISLRTGLYIDGAWRTASDGAEIEVLDPASEEVIASVASASVEDGLAAVEADPPRTARLGRYRTAPGAQRSCARLSSS